VFNAKLLAKAVFADPELTLDLPPSVTASTGMDALTHNVESYLSPDYHPMCDASPSKGTRIAARSLARAVREPKNLGARSDMMMSSLMGAVAFQKDLGATHSCAHALGAVKDLHHGLANAIMIDFALGDNAKRGGPALAERFETMARTLRLSEPTAAGFLSWLSELKAKVGIPKNLSAAGVSREHKARLVELSVADGCHPNNPVPCAAADFERIFSEAFG
jgi:alcohol dehydrogenase class IV